ncbi:MAG TPA: hypothetical protein VGM37_08580 [Armatimonadota bacterium]|jgi:hypothetical protein
MTATLARPEVSSLLPLLVSPKARRDQKRDRALARMRRDIARRAEDWSDRLRVHSLDDPKVVHVNDDDGDAICLSVEAVGEDLVCPITLKVSLYLHNSGASDEPAYYAAATCPVCGRLLHLGDSLGRKDLDAAMDRVARHVESCPGEVAP